MCGAELSRPGRPREGLENPELELPAGPGCHTDCAAGNWDLFAVALSQQPPCRSRVNEESVLLVHSEAVCHHSRRVVLTEQGLWQEGRELCSGNGVAHALSAEGSVVAGWLCKESGKKGWREGPEGRRVAAWSWPDRQALSIMSVAIREAFAHCSLLRQQGSALPGEALLCGCLW